MLRSDPKNLLDEISTTPDSQTPSVNKSDGVYLFVSFDLANSTSFKYGNENWARELNDHIRNLIMDSSKLVDENTQIRVYRIIGDEVIFEIPVTATDSIISILDRVQTTISNFINRVSDGKKSKSGGEKDICLGIQATVWLISANKESADPLATRFIEYSPTAENSFIGDYIGVDMDLGFRLREYRTDSLVQITPDIARLILEKSENLANRLFFTGDFNTAKSGKDAEFLKEHLPEKYPMICYFNPGISGDDIFSFCKKNHVKCRSYEEPQKAMDEALFNEYMESDFIKQQNRRARETLMNRDGNELLTVSKADHLQLHLVAVCVDTKTNRILCFRRSKTHKHGGGGLDFGCVRASSGKTMSTILTEEYEKYFGVKIRLIMDPARTDRQPVPLAVYELDRKDNFKKGIIFMAEIAEGFDAETFQESADYSQAVWIDKDNLHCLASEAAVNDFEITCRTVFNSIEGRE